MMKFAERMRLFLLFTRKRSLNSETVQQDPTLCFCGHRRDAHAGFGLAVDRPVARACRHCHCSCYAEAKETP
jgi:hypothetical protein